MNSAPQKSVSHLTETAPTAVPSLLQHRRFTRRWRWAIALVAGIFLVYGIAGYLGCASMIGENPRWRGMNRGPQDFGLTDEVVSFRSQDGISLKAWWLPAQGASHGSIIQVMLPRASSLVRGGYNVLAVDLRGHGESAAQYASPGYLLVW
jgi:hypothetical protein